MFPQEGAKPMSAEAGEKIKHVSSPISKKTTLMNSDTARERTSHFSQGNNFSISINTDSKEKAGRFFNGLSEDGTATRPMSETFWSPYFGMLTYKFGINWMVSFDNTPQS